MAKTLDTSDAPTNEFCEARKCTLEGLTAKPRLQIGRITKKGKLGKTIKQVGKQQLRHQAKVVAEIAVAKTAVAIKAVIKLL